MTNRRHHPRKRFGQHFLTDHSVLGRLVAALDVGEGQRVLEIGPGLGALTDALVEKVERLVVVELDRDLAQQLRRRYPPERVRVIQADILDFRLADALAADSADTRVADQRLRVVGNLPYNISTPLIFHLLEQVEHIHDMLFMFQKEVALRLAAVPGHKNYGRLSVMTATTLDCELLFDVSPQAFEPPPKVHSTVLRLTPKKQPLRARDRRVFAAVVATAFGQRRKTIRNALATLAQSEHFARAAVDPTLRAGALSVAQYIALADALTDTLVTPD